ncbi:ABC transporter substrate-binding protein [Halobacteriaceae archaeon GCM10025711]
MSPDDPPRVSRRAALASLAGVAAASVSGCVQRVESVVARDGPNPVSLSIKTPPADDDSRAIRIARYLADRLQTVGVGTQITPMSHEELLRDVLLNHDFDLYVARHPENADPDFLRPLLHSRFAAEPGWQNPFGYANLSLDESLADQRSQSGEERADTLADVQHAVVRDQPFAVVAFPDEIRTSRSDRVTGWSNAEIHSPLGYLELDAVDTAAAAPNEVRMTLADDRPTFNRNPLSVEFRAPHPLTDLLYDPPARWVDGELVPWLAASWTWVEDGDGDGGPVADLVLRPDLTWQDGTSLTAEDVAFTYRFLADTSDGSMESAVPAPRFRGRVSLVDSVSVRESGHASGAVVGGESRTVRVTFKPSSRAVAARAFSVPVLPSTSGRCVRRRRPSRVSTRTRP